MTQSQINHAIRVVRRSLPEGAGCIVLFAVLVRSGALLLVPGALEADPDGYRAVAENLLQYGTFGAKEVPTAYRPPLYPVLLAGCLLMGPWSRAAIGALHLVLGMATVWITCRLGERWGLGRWAWLAATLVACDPILVNQSTQVMTETSATFLAAASLFWLTRTAQDGSVAGALAAGACVGLATLCRPTFLPWAVLAALALVGCALRTAHATRKAVSPSSAQDRWAKPTLLVPYVAGLALAVAPWGVRNQIQFGWPIVTTTHGGYTLLRANNPYFYEYLRGSPRGTAWDSAELDRDWLAKAPRGTPADEVRADRLAYAEALAAICREPGMFAHACLARVGRLFAFAPYPTAPQEGTARRVARHAVGLWYLAELPLALAGLAVVSGPGPEPRRNRHAPRNDKIGWLVSLLMVGCFTAVHALYWTDMRMRAPLMPGIALAAAAGVQWVNRLVDHRKLLGGHKLNTQPPP